MQIRELAVPHAIEFRPVVHRDSRGSFAEWYRFEALESAVGHRLDLRQANISVSELGVVRGIHYALVPPGQAKLVTVTHGRVLDIVVDLREGSPTFGSWDSVELDGESQGSVYIAEGLGHAVVALTAGAVLTYLVSEVFNAERELALDVTDSAIGLTLPTGVEMLRSPKDVAAPGLEEARLAGALPTWTECLALYEHLREQSR